MPRYFIQLSIKAQITWGFKTIEYKKNYPRPPRKLFLKLPMSLLKQPVQDVLILVFMRQIKLFTSIQTQEEV